MSVDRSNAAGSTLPAADSMLAMGLRYRGLLLLAALTCLAGCAEVEETLRFDSKGGGTYTLLVRWDADLWRRIGGVVGKDALGRIEGRHFPLRARVWKAAVAGVTGVKAETIEETDAGEGRRELRVVLGFDSLASLLRVEMLARRSMRVVTAPERPGSDSRVARLEMTPITAVPVLDPLAALFNAVDQPPAGAKQRSSPRDPTPLARVGVKADDAEMVRRLLEPALEQVRFTFRVEVPGVVVRVGGEATSRRDEHAEQRFDFGTLRDLRADRRVRLAWRVRTLDTPPVIDHRGDRASAVRKGPGR